MEISMDDTKKPELLTREEEMTPEMPTVPFGTYDWQCVLKMHAARQRQQQMPQYQQRQYQQQQQQQGQQGQGSQVQPGQMLGEEKKGIVRVHLQKNRGRRPRTKGPASSSSAPMGSGEAAVASLPGQTEIKLQETLDAWAVKRLGTLLDGRGGHKRRALQSLSYSIICAPSSRSHQRQQQQVDRGDDDDDDAPGPGPTDVVRKNRIHPAFVPHPSIWVPCACCGKIMRSTDTAPLTLPCKQRTMISFFHAKPECQPQIRS